MIQGDIGPLSEVDHPLAKLWRKLFGRTADLRVLAERFYALPDHLDSTLSRMAALGS
jgi:hypothetical protein